MSLLLAIETSTTVCSVAIMQDKKIVASKTIDNGFSHAENLTPFIQELMQDKKLSFNQLSAVAVSKGPGSYTGLRIGVSTAKGICFALNIPLISVCTLKAMAAQMVGLGYKHIIPLIDARRMEVYTAVYNDNLHEIEKVQPKIIDEQSFQEYLQQGKVAFFGNGAKKTQELIKHPNAIFFSEKGLPNAEYVAKIGWEKYENKNFEDVAYFEPNYLKAFKTTTPKKLL